MWPVEQFLESARSGIVVQCSVICIEDLVVDQELLDGVADTELLFSDLGRPRRMTAAGHGIWLHFFSQILNVGLRLAERIQLREPVRESRHGCRVVRMYFVLFRVCHFPIGHGIGILLGKW